MTHRNRGNSEGEGIDFFYSDTIEPHKGRTRALLAEYPQVRALSGPLPLTALFILLLVSVQIWLALALAHLGFWKILLCSYFIGAILNHGLFVLIHECTHNLVFKSTFSNRIFSFLANLPIGFPMAASFRKYHLLHHKNQGNPDLDADLPFFFEARFVGDSVPKKILWLGFFSLVEGALRPLGLKQIKFLDRWTIINLAVESFFVFSFIFYFGWLPYTYLLLSTFFSVGLHPLGARWIQEHFVVQPGQETYSYYGPLNKVSFNVGYHNEHHDLMSVPWLRLPQIRKIAPDFYDTLYSHKSWTNLLFVFLFEQKINLFKRVVRAGKPLTHQHFPARLPRFKGL